MTLLLAAAPAASVKLDSFYDLVVAGGPIMWPLGVCSVAALAFMAERWLRLRRGNLGARTHGQAIVAAFKDGGAPRALEACAKKDVPLSRILAAGLERAGDGTAQVEKAVEEHGSREVRRLGASLRPLAVIVSIAPLLGLLGTVWGILLAFTNIALEQGMGKPELLADGIAQALVTTVAGLAIAIPTQAAYFWFKAKIDRFVRDVEETWSSLELQLRGAR